MWILSGESFPEFCCGEYTVQRTTKKTEKSLEVGPRNKNSSPGSDIF